MESLINEKQKVSDELRAANNELTAARRNSALKQEQLDSLRRETDNLHQVLNTAKEELRTLTNVFAGLKRCKPANDEHEEELNAAQDVANYNVNKCQTKVDSAQRNLDSAVTKFQSAQIENTDAQTKLQSAHEKLSITERKLESVQQAFNKAEVQNFDTLAMSRNSNSSSSSSSSPMTWVNQRANPRF